MFEIQNYLKNIGLISSDKNEKLSAIYKTTKHLRCNTDDIIDHLSTKTIIYFDYYISHDGYDEFGPKSNIYHLFFITDEDKLYHYSYEDWFYGVNPIRLEKSFDLHEDQKDLIEYSFFDYLDDSQELFENIKIKNGSR